MPEHLARPRLERRRAAAGKALLDACRESLITRFAPVVAGWDPAELDRLTDGLTRLAAAMTRERRAAAAQPGRSTWWRADITVRTTMIIGVLIRVILTFARRHGWPVPDLSRL